MDLLSGADEKKRGSNAMSPSGPGPSNPAPAKKPRSGEKGNPPSTVLKCICCTEERYNRTRFCLAHKQAYDCMYYQFVTKISADKKRGGGQDGDVVSSQQAKEEFLTIMTNDTEAAKAVLHWASKKIATKKHSRKSQITWAEFRREFSVKRGNLEQGVQKPMEAEEFIRIYENKGWSRMSGIGETSLLAT